MLLEDPQEFVHTRIVGVDMTVFYANIATEELYRWNNANAVARHLMLQPVKWETHSSPQMGAHPQKIINENLLIDADIAVGIFGTRIGTATDDYISGTVEEIKKHVAAGKLAMLYFSRVPVDISTVDLTQYQALLAFKEECRQGGLYSEFETHEDFRTKFGHHLDIELNKPQYNGFPYSHRRTDRPPPFRMTLSTSWWRHRTVRTNRFGRPRLARDLTCKRTIRTSPMARIDPLLGGREC